MLGQGCSDTGLSLASGDGRPLHDPVLLVDALLVCMREHVCLPPMPAWGDMKHRYVSTYPLRT